MIDQIKISAIIPCYNVATYIGRAVKSIVAQSYPISKIICVNDGSTDNTFEVLKGLQQKYHITVISTKNKGASSARNTGLKEANGTYIQFLDADDYLEQDKIKHQVSMLSGPKPAFIASSYSKLFADGKKVIYPVEQDSWIALANARLGSTCSNLWNKQSVLDVGGWNEDAESSQEADLMFRILQHNEDILHDQKPLTVINQQRDSISTRSVELNRIRYLDLRFQIWDYLVAKDKVTDERKKEIGQAIFDAIRMLYNYNKTYSLSKYHNQFKKMKIKPGQSAATSSLYLFFYRMFGFNLAQTLSSLIKRK